MAGRPFGAARGDRRSTSALTAVARVATRRPVWVLVGWLLTAVALNVAVPQLEQVTANDTTPFVPGSAPAVQAFERMDRAFGSGEGKAVAFIAITSTRGFTSPDVRRWYDGLAQRLHADARQHHHVADLQDWATQPALKATLVSHDGKATYLPVALRDPLGSPEADKDVSWLRSQVSRAPPAGVAPHITGDPATVADLNTGVDRSIARVTVVTLVIIIGILLLLYRSLLLPLVPLATIGIALLTARGLVALLGQSFLPVSTYTGIFITALVLGAGTDYAVFLISRHHEAMRGGDEPKAAVVEAVRRIGPVIVASGLTVVVGSACMAAAKLALFNTTGPAIAIAVLVTLVVGLTFTPAVLTLLGRRAGPRDRRSRSGSRWARIGALVAARPGRIAVASIVLLAVLAAFAPTLHATYDTRALEPGGSDSQAGYDALDRHFPPGELHPDYVLVTSDRDMRSSRDLVVLDQAAAALAALPGVQEVSDVTRPQGRPIARAQLSRQLGTIARQLHHADAGLTASRPKVQRLATGAHQLAGGAHRVSHGAAVAANAVDRFVAGLANERNGLGTAVGSTGQARTAAARLRDGAVSLADGLQQAHDQTGTAVRGLATIHAALAADSVCSLDPICAASRKQLQRITVAERDKLVPGLAAAARAARRISHGDGNLAGGLAQLQAGLRRAHDGAARLERGERTYRSKLTQLSGGAANLAAGASQLPPGVSRLTSATGRLDRGLARASTYLSGSATTTQRAGADVFYLPPQQLHGNRLAPARSYFLSKDGRTARFLVLTKPGVTATGGERDAASQALNGTPLAGAAVTVTGPNAVEADLRDIVHGDFWLVAIVTLSVVFLILALLLRALVAPIYLLASVLLSYSAAMGLSTLLFIDLLGKPLDFTAPLLAFVVLIAVGADYNILLMSRVREESERASRRGVARAVTATGGVITSAGLIFAGSFIAMTSSPVIGLEETGFAVAAGLLLDTFVVRSLLVPSIAALLGRANFWPSTARSGRTGRIGRTGRRVPAVLAGIRHPLTAARERSSSDVTPS